MPTSPGFVALNVKPESRDALRRLVFKLSTARNARVSMSDALYAACVVADAHINDVASILTDVNDE